MFLVHTAQPCRRDMLLTGEQEGSPPNHISKLIMDGDNDESQGNIAAVEDE